MTSAMAGTGDDLLEGLAALGCRIDTADNGTLVSLPEDYGEFVFERMGGLLYIGTTFMAPEEFEDSEFAAVLDRFLLELQDRNLGCHFSYDRAGFLSVGAELYPSQQSPDETFQIMEQIAYVIDVCLPLCDRVLDSGEIPPDDEIDGAFGVLESLH